MEEELEKYRSINSALCDKLIRDLNRNQNDADSFFHGDIYKAYIDATEKATERAQKIKNKIRKL